MKRHWLAFPTALLALVLSAGASLALPPDDGDKTPPPAKEKKAMRKEMGGRMALAISMRLGEALKLDDAGTIRLYQSIKKHQDGQRAARDRMRESHDALQEALDKDEKNEAKLKDLTAKVLEQRAAMAKSHEKLMDDLKSQLTVVQQARLVSAMPRIHREIRQMMRLAVHGKNLQKRVMIRRGGGKEIEIHSDGDEGGGMGAFHTPRPPHVPGVPGLPEPPTMGEDDDEGLLAFDPEDDDEREIEREIVIE